MWLVAWDTDEVNSSDGPALTQINTWVQRKSDTEG